MNDSSFVLGCPSPYLKDKAGSAYAWSQDRTETGNPLAEFDRTGSPTQITSSAIPLWRGRTRRNLVA